MSSYFIWAILNCDLQFDKFMYIKKRFSPKLWMPPKVSSRAQYCETQNSWRCLRYRHSHNEIQSVRPRARDSLSVKERSLIQTCPYYVIGQSLLTQMSTLCPHGAQLFIQRVNCTYIDGLFPTADIFVSNRPRPA